jgi:shikimate dehydrogenase
MLIRCAVLGSPIAHSLSPVLHRSAYAELGLDWRYDAIEVTEESLPAFLDALGPRWRGLSLTMPLKRAVVGRLDTASATVRLTGAANTVLREPGGRLLGHNTDVPGFCDAVSERDLPAGTAVVLGGGATATSAVAGLVRMGCRDVTVAVRDPARAEQVLSIPGTTVRVVHLEDLAGGPGRVDLLVSTIPAAAHPPISDVPAAAALFDVIYDPWPTPLAAAFSRAARPVIGGLDLLVHQAARQVELMTGIAPAPLAAMRAAGERALRDRA